MDGSIKPSLLHGLDAHSGGLLLSRLLTIADDAVIVADDQHRVVLFNEGAERCFGWRAASVVGQPLAMLLPVAARERHGQQIRAFALSPRAARRMGERGGLHGQRADGSLFDAEASISHVDLNGRTYFTAILRDVSAARQSARSLAASEARFRNLAAAAPVGIFQTDAQGAWCYVNDRWCEIAGMAAADATGHGWLRALHPADQANVLEAWREAVAGQRAFALRYRYRRPDGHENWVLANAVASRDGAGRIDGFIGTVTDVTESHQQALALERAKAKTEAAARAKGLLLANVSHEIRTPLNAVLGMTTLLLDTPLSPDQRDFARTIRSSSNSLLQVVNDLLDYSKVNAGKLEIEQHAFDLRRLVEESLDLLTASALEKHLNLAYLIEDGTPEALVGDPARLRQILVNLLSNAVKFTHRGEVLVTVDSQRIDETTERIHFAVRDTGIGIAADQLPRLFQSFTQVDASTTRKYGGTGLGLAISRRLAELMGGELSAESEPGQGSVFHATVRVARTASDEPDELLQHETSALVGKRILIVSGYVSNRRLLTQLALRWGMKPSTLTALEARDSVRQGKSFDVAVLDVTMPDIDDYELVAEIRRRRQPDELPIVLLTSLGQRHARLRDGLSICLSKPIRASPLFTALVAATGGAARAQAPLTAGPADLPAPVAQPKLRVLVAEDDRTNQRVMLRLLQHLGCEADLAADGQQAVVAVRQRPYDVVLMDIQMPELDGVQAVREIVRERGAHTLPRIIAMTANAMPGDREIYLAVGMDGYLAKPIELASLADALAQNPAHADKAAAWPAGVGHDEQVLDRARLEHLRAIQDDNQPTLVRELIDQFIVDSPDHVQRLVDAYAAGDARALRAQAHRFLSATQNIGALRLAGLCAALEHAARHDDLSAAAHLVAALTDEQRHAHDALTAARLRY